MITLGVVADSHVPDRRRVMPSKVKDVFCGVNAILHAGDVCVKRVLDELSEIAPVHAVSGNRDWFLRLPSDLRLEFGGVQIGLTHGHGSLWRYAVDKAIYLLTGYYEGHYVEMAQSRFANAPIDALIFGHTHRPINRRAGGVLIFNPGSLGPDYYAPYWGPVVGLLHIENGVVSAEIVPL